MNDLVFRLGKSRWILKSQNMKRSSWNCKVFQENVEIHKENYLCLQEDGRCI